MEDSFSQLVTVNDAVCRLPRRGFERDNVNKHINELQDLTGEQIRKVLEVADTETQKLRCINTVLASASFQDRVRRGEITFGLIKPRANTAKVRNGSDQEIADRIEAAIRPPLSIVASQNFFVNRAAAEAFYGHLKSLGPDIFERVVSFISSGTLTGLVLLSVQGNAVQAWRDQMGPTDPTTALPGTIRGDFAEIIENNVVHGSDDIESVRRELQWFQEQLKRLNS